MSSTSVSPDQPTGNARADSQTEPQVPSDPGPADCGSVDNHSLVFCLSLPLKAEFWKSRGAGSADRHTGPWRWWEERLSLKEAADRRSFRAGYFYQSFLSLMFPEQMGEMRDLRLPAQPETDERVPSDRDADLGADREASKQAGIAGRHGTASFGDSIVDELVRHKKAVHLTLPLPAERRWYTLVHHVRNGDRVVPFRVVYADAYLFPTDTIVAAVVVQVGKQDDDGRTSLVQLSNFINAFRDVETSPGTSNVEILNADGSDGNGPAGNGPGGNGPGGNGPAGNGPGGNGLTGTAPGPPPGLAKTGDGRGPSPIQFVLRDLGYETLITSEASGKSAREEKRGRDNRHSTPLSREQLLEIGQFNNKFRVFSVVETASTFSENLESNGHRCADPGEPTAYDQLLYELGSVSPIGSATDPEQNPKSMRPAAGYYRNLLAEQKLEVFNNWSALGLLDTFTVLIHPPESRSRPFSTLSAFNVLYLPIYIHNLHIKSVLFHTNRHLSQRTILDHRNRETRDRFVEFVNRYYVSHVSFNFLPNVLNRAMANGLDLEPELVAMREKVEDIKAAIDERQDRRTNRMLLVISVLAVGSAIYDSSEWLQKVLSFGDPGYSVWSVTFAAFVVIGIAGLSVGRRKR